MRRAGTPAPGLRPFSPLVMSASASSSPSVVPCLAELYLALGAGDEPGAQHAVSFGRRAVAAVAASLLALSVVAWPAAPPTPAEAPSPALERPAGTLPEHMDLVPGEVPE